MEPELKFEGRKLQWKKLELPRTVYRELLEVSWYEGFIAFDGGI
jgi:hypothetical protein